MRAMLAILLSIPLLLTACSDSEKKEKEKAEADAPPPPPPTAKDIAQKIINETQLEAPIPPAGTVIPKDAAAQYMGMFQNHKNVHANTPEGKQALQMVTSRVESRIRQMEKAKTWEPLLLMCNVYSQVLNPGSKKYNRQMKLAKAELEKPQITIKGIVKDGTTGIKIALLDIYLPNQKETINDRIRVGEEKYGIKLQQVIGNDQGLLFEYGSTGETFEVMTNKARQ